MDLAVIIVFVLAYFLITIEHNIKIDKLIPALAAMAICWAIIALNLDGFREWLFEQNIVYIGGGNTNYMLNLWSENNLKDIFKEAYEKGIILSGVSAGAVCWFEWILTDSLGDGYQPLKGVGLLEGSCTPHSSDLNRINEFENNIKNSKLPPGFAIDDGVAVLFIDGKPSDVYSARKNHNAYFVNKENKISLNEYIKNIE